VNYHKSLQQYCVIFSKIALKQVFMAFGRALPNHCFVGKKLLPFFMTCFIIFVLYLEQKQGKVGLLKCILL